MPLRYLSQQVKRWRIRFRRKLSLIHIYGMGPEETSEIRLKIFEGKFHQVKRMVHAVGKEVIYLKRLSMGSLRLDETLRPGEYRQLSTSELEELYAD